ncbi:MAG: hypothetical protein AAGA92_13625, partial [Planctomycetota bacterium]
MADTMAATTYTLERNAAPSPKKWGSVVLAFITGLMTSGGGSTPVAGDGVRILDHDGTVLAEVS